MRIAGLLVIAVAVYLARNYWRQAEAAERYPDRYLRPNVLALCFILVMAGVGAVMVAA